MATGPGFYDNLCPQSWQDGSAATWTLQDPHQQSKSHLILLYKLSVIQILLLTCVTSGFVCFAAFDCPGN
jgi:hypothetical protein